MIICVDFGWIVGSLRGDYRAFAARSAHHVSAANQRVRTYDNLVNSRIDGLWGGVENRLWGEREILNSRIVTAGLAS